MYNYAATITRVIDGDTISLEVDLGFGVILTRRTFRLAGCNARELAAPGGPEARDHLAALLPSGTRVSLTSVKVDKYGGRFDADVVLPDGRNLTELLVTTGWAAPWTGHGPKPDPTWPRPA